MKLASAADSPALFKVSSKIESFMYDLVPASQTSLIRKWVYHKAVYHQ